MSANLKILLSGQKYFGQEALRMFRQTPGVDVAAVVAPFDAEGGGQDKLWELAGAYRLPRIPSDELKAETLPPGIDLIVCAHSHAFVGRKTILKTTHGAIGYHPSLLPRHRGRDAVRWALKMNDPITGGTVYWLTANVDAGPIAAQRWCWIRPGDTAGELWRRELLPLGLSLLARTVEDVRRGVIVRVPQDEDVATWEPAIDQPKLHRVDLEGIGDGKGKPRSPFITELDKAFSFYAVA